MSTSPLPVPEKSPEAREHVKNARLRAATVRARLHLATDALAAADLLLGMNASVGAMGRGRAR